MNPTLTDKSAGHVSPAFVHHVLDDADLSPSEFRVLMHICRRCGNMANGRRCEACVETMAETCHLRPNTVRKCLKNLVALGWLSAVKRNGATTIYTPVFPAETASGNAVETSPEVTLTNDDAPVHETPPARGAGGIASGQGYRHEPGDLSLPRTGDPSLSEPAKGKPSRDTRKGNRHFPVPDPEDRKELQSQRVNRGKGSLQEVTEFTMGIGLTRGDGEFMFHKWESNGWLNGAKPVKDWQAQIRSWKAAGYLPSQKLTANQNGAAVPDGAVVIAGRVFR